MAKLLHPFLKIILGLILLVTSASYITIKNDQVEKNIVNTFKDRIYSENIEFYLVSKTGNWFSIT